MWLGWRGLRCWTITIAAGKLAGRVDKTALMACESPAEATMVMTHAAGTEFILCSPSKAVREIIR